MTNPFLNYGGDRFPPGGQEHSFCLAVVPAALLLQSWVHFSGSRWGLFIPQASKPDVMRIWMSAYLEQGCRTNDRGLSVCLSLCLSLSVMVQSLGFNPTETWRLSISRTETDFRLLGSFYSCGVNQQSRWNCGNILSYANTLCTGASLPRGARESQGCLLKYRFPDSTSDYWIRISESGVQTPTF